MGNCVAETMRMPLPSSVTVMVSVLKPGLPVPPPKLNVKIVGFDPLVVEVTGVVEPEGPTVTVALLIVVVPVGRG
jgi:hypothetical protein